MAKHKKLLSVIIPVFNEAENLAWHHKELAGFFRKHKLNYEIVYVNDGSADESLELIKQLSEKDSNVKYISFSRNFGKEVATSAGLQACTGDAALMIDADGQHPIELVSEFLKQWEDGHLVVIGVRRTNKNEGFVKKYGSKLFYGLFNVFADQRTVPAATDFRLLDRRVIEEFKRLPERNRMTRSLIDWLGFKRAYVPFDAAPRKYGEAGYKFSKLVRLAIHTFVSQTFLPLRLSGYLGILITVASALIGVFLVVQQFVFGDPLHLGVSGTALLAIFLTFLVGIVLMCQGLLALYIESIHTETQSRPLFIVSESNIDGSQK